MSTKVNSSAHNSIIGYRPFSTSCQCSLKIVYLNSPLTSQPGQIISITIFNGSFISLCSLHITSSRRPDNMRIEEYNCLHNCVPQGINYYALSLSKLWKHYWIKCELLRMNRTLTSRTTMKLLLLGTNFFHLLVGVVAAHHDTCHSSLDLPPRLLRIWRHLCLCPGVHFWEDTNKWHCSWWMMILNQTCCCPAGWLLGYLSGMDLEWMNWLQHHLVFLPKKPNLVNTRHQATMCILK